MVGRDQMVRSPGLFPGFVSWSAAMERALYGPKGFYRTQGDSTHGGPAAHFRTSVHASPLFAAAIVRLLRETDEALGHPSEIALVDVGAGRGELLEAVHAQLTGADSGSGTGSNTESGSDSGTGSTTESRSDTDSSSDIGSGSDIESRSRSGTGTETSDNQLGARLKLIAVEVAERPDNLTASIIWRSGLPADGSVTGLLVANEWLDNVPCDIAQATPGGWRSVEVSADGTERLGAAPAPDQQHWLSAWWPTDASSASASDRPPTRAEIGLTRDAAWQRAVATLARGVAVAIDYAHTRAARPPFGTLSGYAHGRQTVPVPDGSCDITAHVALDACAAVAATRADWTIASVQRTVLHSLGITGARPDLSLASSDPRSYLRALSHASAAAELTDADGLGGFGWLIQGVSAPVPTSLARLTPA